MHDTACKNLSSSITERKVLHWLNIKVGFRKRKETQLVARKTEGGRDDSVL